MFGNCAIGSVGIEMMPSSRMTSENTDAKIGRLRKNSTTVPSTARRGEWLLPGTPGLGLALRQPAVERGALAHHPACDVLHGDDRVRPQRLARRGVERAQRFEDRKD